MASEPKNRKYGLTEICKRSKIIVSGENDIVDQRGDKSRLTGGHMSERVIKGLDDCSGIFLWDSRKEFISKGIAWEFLF